MTNSYRLPVDEAPYAVVDHNDKVDLVVDGKQSRALRGDTVASAMLASGFKTAANSLYFDRPRGVFAAGVEEPNSLVHLSPRHKGDVEESMMTSTTVPVTNGLEATKLSGLGTLDPTEDQAYYDHVHVHTDVLVVGAGPAGLSAAANAAKSGARVILMDEKPWTGGSLLDSPYESIDDVAAPQWIADTVEALKANDDVEVLSSTTVTGVYDSNYVIAAQRRTHTLDEHPGKGISRERIWHVRAQQVVLATGAHERPLVFKNNDRPGVMLASAVRTYLNRYAVRAGKRIAVFTTNDSVYPLVHELQETGGVVAVVDSRSTASPAAQQAAANGVNVLIGSAVVDTHIDDDDQLNAITVAPINGEVDFSKSQRLEVDTLAVSGGWSPVVHLHSGRKGRIDWDEQRQGFVAVDSVEDMHLAGSLTGKYSTATALSSGAAAGAAAATAAGFPTQAEASRAIDRPYGPVEPLWLVPSPDGTEVEHYNSHYVDLQRDQTVADVLRATGAGMSSVEHVKRYTSISTGADQGKTSGVPTIGVMASILGIDNPQEIGTTTFRPPFTPVGFAALAGRRRGKLFEAARTTPMHDAHVAAGAVFEDVGQWKRAWYYPKPGETMDEAVYRESAAARDSVGMFDGTTLGKIELRGKDTPEFLNRLYTNGWVKLKEGMGRYGVMLSADGMIFDDGVTLRLEEDRYFMHTTTSGAADVMEWVEEWLQTEWPELDVYATSVTEQYATIAVVGPKSRDVMAKLATTEDFSAEGFKFMEFRDITLDSGIAARVSRISFSGELAWEIAIPSWYGLAVWEAVAQAGKEFDITPYGTETMHVLRAEKGLIVVGQETDGTVTPQDANLEWILAKHKDFIGKRSFSRADNVREDRKQLVSVLPDDPTFRLEEGEALVAMDTPIDIAAGPVAQEGWVTASYDSPNLGRTFGLALIKNGFSREGESLKALVGDEIVTMKIGPTVLYDPQGARRDG
ncbi:2Fe-2S iron-sulfur cluster-binding protein [Yaniella halotolerans]|uniref:2Fe-2S iron-sulfur cluster-binding protein n=1 Tax=Yaniella halotolerans TaxID=225453 RepID=UPI0003B718BE